MSWADERRSGVSLKRAAKYVLPPIAIDVARRLTARSGPPARTAGAVPTSYELAPAWTRAKVGTAAFDFDVVNRPIDWELRVPIVRDNLEALGLIKSPEAGLRLLDFGCSNGHYKLILAANHHTSTWQYVGVDLPPQIEFCRQSYPHTLFQAVEGGGPLPFGNDEFDVVLASSVIQYIREPLVVLEELQRVSREYVIVSRVPTWKYEQSRVVVQHLHAASGEEWYPLHVFNRRVIEQSFEKTGLSIAFRDSGSEYFWVPGIPEPVTNTLYLLRKPPPE